MHLALLHRSLHAMPWLPLFVYMSCFTHSRCVSAAFVAPIAVIQTESCLRGDCDAFACDRWWRLWQHLWDELFIDLGETVIATIELFGEAATLHTFACSQALQIAIRCIAGEVCFAAFRRSRFRRHRCQEVMCTGHTQDSCCRFREGTYAQATHCCCRLREVIYAQ